VQIRTTVTDRRIDELERKLRAESAALASAVRPRIVISATAAAQDLDAVRNFLDWLWAFRPCSICLATGACRHREPDVDIARARGWIDTLRAQLGAANEAA
jgi:hypothetical protein